jgi:hypothetical protein
MVAEHGTGRGGTANVHLFDQRRVRAAQCGCEVVGDHGSNGVAPLPSSVRVPTPCRSVGRGHSHRHKLEVRVVTVLGVSQHLRASSRVRH